MRRSLHILLLLAMIVAVLGLGTGSALAQGNRIVHIVRSGEYLELLALRYNTTVAAIANVNNLVNTSRIYPGQQLLIPVGEYGVGGPVYQPVVTIPVVLPVTHIVQAGDTVAYLAASYGTTVNAIVLANNLFSADAIYTGQALVIAPPEYGTGGPVTQPSPVVLPVNYIVQYGDTVASIAARFGTTTNAIVVANNLTSASYIYVGQQLLVPPADYGTGGPVTQPVPTVPQTRVHVVRTYETLNTIAAQYGTSVSALVAANGLLNANYIRIGQSLIIPRLHTVQAGETVANIAAFYGAEEATVRAVNGLFANELPAAGRVLVIP